MLDPLSVSSDPEHMYRESVDYWNIFFNLGLVARKPVFGVCEQHRRRPACASAQSDQRLCYTPFFKVAYVNLVQVKFQFSRQSLWQRRPV